MLKGLWLLIASTLAATVATAQNINACLIIEADLDRLACYDKAAGRTPSKEMLPSRSAWQIETKKSEFKDTTDVFLHVDSEEPVNCGFNGRQPIRLYLRCVENTTALILATHCHVASGFHGYGAVEYRIDDKPAKKRTFDESTNNRSLGLWNGGKSIPVIKSLLGAETLLVRFTPFNENSVSARFPISGLEEAIAPLRESCNW